MHSNQCTLYLLVVSVTFYLVIKSEVFRHNRKLKRFSVKTSWAVILINVCVCMFCPCILPCEWEKERNYISHVYNMSELDLVKSAKHNKDLY